MSNLIEVFRKELMDIFNSRRFIILFLLVYLAGIASIYIAAQNIRSSIDDSTKYVFINLFVVSGNSIPFSFPLFLAVFIPIIGIALGFDAINNERTTGNLSRLLAQPIYRDDIINGKFLAGIVMIALMIMSIVALVAGLGLRMIGVPPEAEEVMRLFIFVLISILYGAFWLSLGILFSILFKKSATSFLASLGIWLFLFLFMSLIASIIAGTIIPVSQNSTIAEVSEFDSLYRMISRLSPSTLYGECVQSILLPEMGNISPTMMMIGIYSGLKPTPLPLSQSLVIIWPQIVGLIALTAICFAVGYMKFMREEIRST